ncbi:MAG: M14 family zinc carboxypeptidase, partial [Polaromonas sp.]|nr:M14 family zinc carboxypeptidase [Polaromonas sp.]
MTQTAPSPIHSSASRSGLLGPALPLLLSLALAACTSVPLPPWPAPGDTAKAPPAVTPAPIPATVAPPVVVIQPVPVRPSGVVAPAEAPYSAAVAARFPAPSLIYSTPGLQEGRSSFTSNAEIQTWLRDLVASAAATPGMKAVLLPIGRSQRGEALEALVLTRGAGTDAAAIVASNRPTVLLIGQQHGDEPAGSEALLVVARELTQGLLRPVLDRVNVIIVPRANPDGATDN